MRPAKPSTDFDVAAIRERLALLTEMAQWVLWRPRWNESRNRWDKVPYRASAPDRKASSTDPESWATFDEAVAAAEQRDGFGIGFVVTEDDDIVGVDLDKCVDGDGVVEPWAVEIAQRVDSYCELSPSGRGLRLFLRGQMPSGSGKRRGKVECYESARFLTVTGNRPPEPLSQGGMREDSDALEWLSRMYLRRREHSRKVGVAGGKAARLTDDQVIAKAGAARNGQKFQRLWRGDTTGYPSQSEADLALVGILGFWTQDPDQLDRLFRQSVLMRGKWDEDHGGQTYGELTIAKVIANIGETYQPTGGGGIERGVVTGGAAEVESDDTVAAVAEVMRRTFVRDLNRAHIQAEQPEPVVSGLLTRGTTTGISAAGGTGKTTLAMQLAFELALNLQVWGHAAFQPEGNRVLYVAGEDVRSSLNYWLDAMMEHFGLQDLPPGLVILPTRELPERGLVLTSARAAALARLVEEESFDVVVLDTAVSLLPGGVSVINPAEVRDWQRSTVGQIEDAGAAVLMLVHDNKAGEAFSGTADWTNFMRLALHLKRAGTNSDGTASLCLKRIKSNFGFPHKTLTIERRGLINAVVVAADSTAGSAEIHGDRLLYDYVESTLLTRPEPERTGKKQVERSLFETFRAKGVTRQCIRRFLDDCCEWEKRHQGRTRPLVLVRLREERA